MRSSTLTRHHPPPPPSTISTRATLETIESTLTHAACTWESSPSPSGRKGSHTHTRKYWGKVHKETASRCAGTFVCLHVCMGRVVCNTLCVFRRNTYMRQGRQLCTGEYRENLCARSCVTFRCVCVCKSETPDKSVSCKSVAVWGLEFGRFGCAHRSKQHTRYAAPDVNLPGGEYAHNHPQKVNTLSENIEPLYGTVTVQGREPFATAYSHTLSHTHRDREFLLCHAVGRGADMLFERRRKIYDKQQRTRARARRT